MEKHGRVKQFGKCEDGSIVQLITLENGGTTISVMTFGASLQNFKRENIDHSLVLGSPSLEPYFTSMRYFGATAGPVANRIANGQIKLNNRVINLDCNENNTTTLHGGSMGCSDLNWKLEGYDENSCRFALQMVDGLCGFPGNRCFTVTYTLAEDGALVVEMTGRTDSPTICNLAHHSYWNLDGLDTISGHKLSIEADSYLPVNDLKIPMSAPISVEHSRYDFRTPRPVNCKGDTPLDHNFCLRQSSASLRQACVLEGGTGVKLSIQTTEPGLQVYDGFGLSTAPGHSGKAYGPMAGIALEPQLWPDAPNHRAYPSILLQPDDVYHQISRFEVLS